MGDPQLNKIKNSSWKKDYSVIISTQRNLLVIILLFIMLISLLTFFIYINTVSINHSIQPFVIEVEKKSGIATVVEQSTLESYKNNSEIRDYYIYRYIKAREGYDFRTYKHYYKEVVRLLSTPELYSGFARRISTRNESSPINKYGRDFTLVPKIKSIQNLNEYKQVRILVNHISAKSGKVTKSEDKVILLKYYFADLTLSKKDRLINPLNFLVYDYSITNEIIKGKGK